MENMNMNIDELEKTIEYYRRRNTCSSDQEYKKCLQEVKTLKEHIEELKSNGGFVGDYKTSQCAAAMAARLKDEMIRDLKKENKKLTKENKKLTEENENLNEIIDRVCPE
jgi:cell division protein FtsB